MQTMTQSVPLPQTIVEFSAFAGSHPDLNSVLERAVQTVVNSLDATYCRIQKRASDSGTIETVAEAGSGVASEDGSLLCTIEGETAPFGEFVVSSDPTRTFTNEDREFVKSISWILSDVLRRAHYARDRARFRSVVTSVGEAIVEVTTDGRIFNCNAAAECLFGYRREDAIGGHLTMLFRDDLASTARAILNLAVGTASAGPVQTSMRRRDGAEVLVDLSMTPIVLPDGRTVALSLVARNLEEKQRSDRTLRMHANILAHFPDIVMVWRLNDLNDPDSLRFVMTNRAADGEVEAFCLARREVYATVARTARPQRLGERTVRDHDGTDRCFDVEAFPLPDQSVGVVFREVTERRHLTDQLQHAQRMELIGQLAGGIAHDFNNLLTVISGYAELLRRTLADNMTALNDIGEIERASQSAQQLTRQLLTFGRRQVLRPVPLELTTLLRASRGMLNRLIGEDVELIMIGQEPVLTTADPGQIEQVLLNLAVNARDAMPAGGKLLMESSQVHVTAPISTGMGEVPPGDYAVITVSDTGLGMDQATLARVFEPFFTTKEAGKGTGLGLSTVHGILKQSGGYVKVTSEPGEGTSFNIYLPATLDEGPGAAEAIEQTASFNKPCTVLLVEDHEPARSLLCKVLKESGHTVLGAGTPKEALGLAASLTDKIDLLITDVVLPQQSGSELAARLTVRFPNLQTLYISGYSADQHIGHRKVPAGAAFLCKPFSPADLLRAIGQLLAQRAGQTIQYTSKVVM